MEHKIVVLDTETGGLDPQEHSLLQIALLVCENGEIIDSLKINLVHEVYRTQPKALEINKINLETHTGVSPSVAYELIKSFMEKHFEKSAQLAGHNVTFDVGFLKQMFKDLDEDYEALFSHRILDTMSVSRFLVFAGILPKHVGSLGSLVKHFEIEVQQDDLHDALADATATYHLLLEMIKIFPSLATTEKLVS